MNNTIFQVSFTVAMLIILLFSFVEFLGSLSTCAKCQVVSSYFMDKRISFPVLGIRNTLFSWVVYMIR